MIIVKKEYMFCYNTREFDLDIFLMDMFLFDVSYTVDMP